MQRVIQTLAKRHATKPAGIVAQTSFVALVSGFCVEVKLASQG